MEKEKKKEHQVKVIPISEFDTHKQIESIVKKHLDDGFYLVTTIRNNLVFARK